MIQPFPIAHWAEVAAEAVSRQVQVPGNGYVSETGTFQAQVPGGAYMNEGGV